MESGRIHRIFISFANQDAVLASKVKKLLRNSLQLFFDDEQIFFSADSDSIRTGRISINAIRQALWEVDAVVAILTPSSVYRQWPLLEMGGALFGGAPRKDKLFAVTAKGLGPTGLPNPLGNLHVRDLSKFDDVVTLCKEMAKHLGVDSPTINRDWVQAVQTEASKGVKNWSRVRLVPMADEIKTSPFTFQDLLNQAEKELFVTGQNLFFLTREDDDLREERRLALFERLRKGIYVRFMITNPECDYALKYWETVAADKFSEHLQKSVDVFGEWIDSAKKEGLENKLKVRLAPVVPATVSFVDPRHEHSAQSMMVLTPVISPGSQDRPSFAIWARDSATVFNHYYARYDIFWQDGKKLETI